MGGSLSPEAGLRSPSNFRILPRSRLISAFCISTIRELSEGSTLASPVGGMRGFVRVSAACSSKPCLRAMFNVASRSWALVRDFLSSHRRSLISFSRETFSYDGVIECLCVCACMCVCMCACVHVCVCVCVHVCVYSDDHKYHSHNICTGYTTV